MLIEPLVAKQKRSVELATARLNIWEGSVRSSKTVCSLLAWLVFVRTGPAGNLVMVGKTERTLKRNVIDPLVDMLGPKRCRYVQGSGELWLLGRRVYIAGANDERAMDKIRGLTLVGAYVDEASVVPEGFWAMLTTRLSITGARLFATTNPDNPNHWLMKGYLKRARTWLDHKGDVIDAGGELDLHRFSFRIRDNPTLGEDYIRSLELEHTGLWRKRFIEGLWVLAEGAIYDTFEPTIGDGFVVDTLPEMQRWVIALDYGTTNPFVALLIGLGVDDRMYVAREWRWDSRARNAQKTDAEYSTALRAWLEDLDPADNTNRPDRLAGARDADRIIYDPSAASFGAQLWRDQWSGIRKADNRVNDGIRSVASLLAAHRLLIHESCTGTIEEMSGYVWDEKAAKDRGIEQPLKVDDHGPDALRYGVMGTRRWWKGWVTLVIEEEDEAA